MGFPQSNIDWSKYMQGLSSTANRDLSNLSEYGDNKLRGISRVVEAKYNPDGSFYRKYSDGWLEQGGYHAGNTTHVITLFKPFKNTSYYGNCVPFRNSSNSAGWNYHMIMSSSTTTQIVFNDADGVIKWYACGVGA